jgi:hypothetical protein
MKETTNRPDPATILARTSLELLQEYNTCADPGERVTILSELRAVERQHRTLVEQRETLRQLPDLWEAMYGAGFGFLSLFSGQRAGARLAHPQTAYFPYPSHLGQAHAWAQAATAAERDVYMCAHLLREQRRRKEAAAALTTLYVDMDGAMLDTEAVPRPSLTIETSPGRQHCYWYLAEPVAPVVGEALNRQLAHATGADKTGWDLTQLLRVPGSRNHKYADAPLVQVTSHDGRRYQLAEVTNPLTDLPLFTALRARQAAPKPVPAGAAVDLEAVPLSATARRIVLDEQPKHRPDGDIDRSASLLQMGRVLAGAGLPPERIAAFLAERDAMLGWGKYIDRADGLRQYDRIAQLVSRSVRR